MMRSLMRRDLASLALLASFTLAPNASAETDWDPATLLADINAKQQEALARLEEMDGVGQQQTYRVMQRLDAYWHSPEVTERFRELHQAFEQQLSRQEIEGDNSGIVWAQFVEFWKALIEKLQCLWSSEACRANLEAQSDGKLRDLIEAFTQEAFLAIRPLQEQTFRQALAGLEPEVQAALIEAQLEVQRASDEIIASHFDAWGSGQSFPPLEPLASDIDARLDFDHLIGTESGVGLASGIAALVLRDLLAELIPRLVRSTSRELVEKLARKLIPIGGFLTILLDVKDFSEAKAKMEQELRSQLGAQYPQQMAPDLVWRRAVGNRASSRDTTREDVQRYLEHWVRYSKQSAREVLEQAVVLDSPGVSDYLEDARKRGLSREVVTRELLNLRNVFGTLMLRCGVTDLRRMLAEAPTLTQDPSHAFLKSLAELLGEELCTAYRDGGGEFLRAAHVIGVPLIQEVLQSPGLDWRRVSQAFTPLGEAASLEQRRGMLICVRRELDCRMLAGPALARLAAKTDLLQELLSLGVPSTNVLAIFSAGLESVPEALGDASRELMAVAASALSTQALENYLQPEQRRGLILAFAFVRGELGWSPQQATQGIELVQTLAGIVEEHGGEGLALWQDLVGTDGGRAQQRLLQRALRLADEGFSSAHLRTPAAVRMAEALNVLPWGQGPRLMGILHPLGHFATLLVYALGAAAVAVPVLLMVRLARRRRAAR
ncbi:MAG: hypothetical protein AAF560_28040 [Acidobacteriota bacterium]